jgi:hypothetical protein
MTPATADAFGFVSYGSVGGAPAADNVDSLHTLLDHVVAWSIAPAPLRAGGPAA